MIGREKLRTLLVCLALAIGAALLFWPVVTFGFVTLDDLTYLVNNSHVNGGFTWEGLRWCLATRYAAMWHPLTWLSYMLDCQLYGGWMGGVHATNLALHMVSAVLLFLLLRRMTGAFWRSAMVAALFAWHPLHVESVAWLSERKDVLCTVFWMLTLWAYIRYAEKCKMRNAKCKMFYALALVFFALGLMAKPMLVTLPFVLLLLDWWPLRRMQFGPLYPNPNPNLNLNLNLNLNPKKIHGSSDALVMDANGLAESARCADRTPQRGVPTSRDRRVAGSTESRSAMSRPAGSRPTVLRLLIEKIPFFVLSIFISVLAVHAAGTNALSLTRLPLLPRLGNAAVSYFLYAAKMIWPGNLVALYPFDVRWEAWQIAAAFLFVMAVSAAAVRLWKTRPYLLLGWLWFLGTLVPVIGLVRVGAQSMADRYT